jgi:ribonuclease P protein component
MRSTLSKKERLSSNTRIQQLFSTGQAFHVFPLRIIYYFIESETKGVQVLFSVPKKRFKKAVDRNRLKRLCREAYRLQKQFLQEHTISHSICLSIAIIYTGNLPDMPFKEIVEAMKQSLDRLIHITEERATTPRSEYSS